MTEIALVHGSESSLRALERAVAKAPGLRVAWSARDGRSALDALRDAPVSLVLLDARVQRPACAEVVRALSGKCSVLLLEDGSAQALAAVYEAMASATVDVATCPSLDASGALSGEGPLLAKLRSMTSILAAPSKVASAGTQPRVVLIGSSTGGPQALQVIFSALPRDFEAAILVAQHVDSEFTAGLVDWLARETKFDVRLARPDDVPTASCALIAGTNDHMVLTRKKRLSYTDEPRDAPYRPSADELFNSFAAHWELPGVAVLLTGMGRDGARGLLTLRQKGWHTIAQDAASSVVFGMPRAAIELGAAVEVAGLSEMAKAITQAVRKSGRARPAKP